MIKECDYKNVTKNFAILAILCDFLIIAKYTASASLEI